jgi:hypothetical protein
LDIVAPGAESGGVLKCAEFKAAIKVGRAKIADDEDPEGSYR